ncbi:MAG: amylo-alpha-1,6-glucosidase [Phycisphaerae bacterium]
MHLDLSLDAWSRAGSYLQVRRKEPNDPDSPLVYQTVSHSVWRSVSPGVWAPDFFTLQIGTSHAAYRHDATVERLRLHSRTDAAVAELAFADGQTLAVGVTGQMSFIAEKVMGWVACPSPDQVLVFDRHARLTHHFRVLRGGRIEISERDADSATPQNGHPHKLLTVALIANSGERLDAVIRSCLVETRLDDVDVSVDEAAGLTKSEWNRWLARRPVVSEEFETAADYAWYTLWHHRVSPEGYIKRPAIVMGRLWMNMTWPWDACFAALGVGSADVELAFDQVMVHFDHQTPGGQLPDHVHDGEAAFGWLKPPVQGWIVRLLMDQCGVDACRHRLEQLYEPMLRWTQWWYQYRDDDRDGMCQYNHGNDSGWDNSTVYDQGMPTEGVDLAAYLVLQWEALGDIADVLGRPADARRWRARATDQLQALLSHGVMEGQLTSVRSGVHTPQATTSLITRLPILLGKRLPEALRQQIITDLRPDGPWLTRFGPATESTESPKNAEDSYWRGPIWAPPTYMLFDGLRAAGETNLAAELATRFCRTVASQGGMYENYSAITGRGLRCPTYAWTAAVFIRLAEWLHDHKTRHLEPPAAGAASSGSASS